MSKDAQYIVQGFRTGKAELLKRVSGLYEVDQTFYLPDGVDSTYITDDLSYAVISDISGNVEIFKRAGGSYGSYQNISVGFEILTIEITTENLLIAG